MKLSSFRKTSLKSQLPVLAGIVLVFGLFAVVTVNQQRQNTRSRAAGVCAQTTGDLEIDNCTLTGNIVGNLKGNNNTINGNVYGFVIGDGNNITVNIGKSLFGNNNTVGNNVTYCVEGNDNNIANNVGGSVTGSGNTARQVANVLACPPNPYITPTSTPVPPTSAPTPTRVPTPTTVPPTPPNGTCADGIDNNQNELIDGGDPICHTDGNQDNPNSYDPGRNEGQITPTIPQSTPTPTGTPTAVPTSVLTSVPTTTVAPGNASIKLDLFLHGIGKGGDSANPNSGGNPNPLRPQRTAVVEIYNSQNQLVVTKQGNITFNSTNGNFTGQIDLGSTLSTGIYTVKVKTDQFLKTLVPGIQTLTQGQLNQLPPTFMVNGDIDGNNSLNILDYNILIGCYSDFLPAPSCTPATKAQSDLDDDGDVNQFDYNLFLRELTNREGQ